MQELTNELFNHLITQAAITNQATLKAFEGSRISNVFVYPKTRVYHIEITIPAIIEINEMIDFQVAIRRYFEPISQVDFKFKTDNTNYTSSLVYDYWPLVKETLIDDPKIQSFVNAASLHYEDEQLVFLVENQFVKQAFDKECLESIMKGYASFGFNEVATLSRIDEATANDRLLQFEERQKEIEELRLKQAEEALKAINLDKACPKGSVTIKIGRQIKATDEPVMMRDITEEQRNVLFLGSVFSKEIRELRSGRKLALIKITDYSSSFSCRAFIKDEQEEAVFDAIETGMWLKIRGNVQEDTYERDLVLQINDIEQIPHEDRKDTSDPDHKRVELHLHTNMSTLDATNSISDYVNRAKKWGHTAIAITDHAGLQGYPEASAAAKKSGLKMIYGVEAYVVDDGVDIAYNESDMSINDSTYVVFDVETTGLSAIYDSIIELAASKMVNGNIVDSFEAFINPGHRLSELTINLTGITDKMLEGAKPEVDVIKAFMDFCQGSILVAHNASFDMGFLNAALKKHGLAEAENPVIDTLELARFLYPTYKNHRLNTLAKKLEVTLEQHHRANADAEATAQIAWKLLTNAMTNHDMLQHRDLNRHVGEGDAYKRSRPYHMTILAKNQMGLKTLFKLVSASNTEYFFRTPRIPFSLLQKNRENLLIGSGCQNGKVFEALMQKGKEEASEQAKIYDFLEIHPRGYYKPLIHDELIRDEKTLTSIMTSLYEISQEVQIPLVATGNVHYLNENDHIYREILKTSIKSNKMTVYPEAHFRSTNEMLDAFNFMGEEVAEEIVVTNSNLIADQIEFVEPLKDQLYTPSMENADENIKEMSYSKAKSIYGEELPELIEKRLEKELNSIISNGFSVIYLISQKLVQKSNDDGYIVGSRGSVGSSFVATMTGITEVNPLPPHYVCPNCQYSKFFDDGSVGSGFDLKDAPCPECGALLNKDGQDIPFETFLGFKGDKVPDIDLNFSGEYQAKAHAYTKVLFGEDHVFRAGTISTVADKTAFGYVKGYERDKNLHFRNAEVDRLAKGSSGVKRTTGQHPGGIIVIPENMDVYDFTPIQYPADDVKSEWLTTHFDFHSIHDNVLKLDILGHDDPTVIRMLQDLSGIAPTDIPVDDEKVYSLFSGTDALGVTPQQIFSKTGTLGIPEFGTSFTRSMLEQTNPTTFAELLQISGLSHGTDVWLGNAEVLIRDHGLKLSECIGCRDDIMVFLIYQGLEESTAFQIMESVRKGKGLTEEQKAVMRENEVPEWYIESCLKIKYMFPKAHAAAYVLNAIRVAWFKVHHPIWYYCAYMSVRASDFDIIAMCEGKEAVKREMKKIYDLGNAAGVKEKNLLTVLELANEMLERGFEFKMVDINKSDASKFIIEGNSLIAPFRTIPGLGAGAAQQIVIARNEKEFISKEDLSKRGKVGAKLIEYMTNQHVLDHLPDENQLSLFDF